MRPALRTLSLLLSVTAPLAFAALGCGKMTPRSLLTANQPPVIHLERPTIGSDGEVGFRWRAIDPDGRVDHFVYAVNPRSVDRVDPGWSTTRELATTVRFPRSVALGRAELAGAPAGEPHIFAVRAVDDGGELSDPVAAGMFGDSLAPTVFITTPPPNPVFLPIAPPTVTIQWRAIDDDGRIAQYKYQLFTEHNPDFPAIPNFIAFALSNPDSFRSLYAPGFTSWDSVGANVTSATYTNLETGQSYLFAITAYDRAGHYDPVFSGYKNLLVFTVSTIHGYPQLVVGGPFFNYVAPSGGDLSLSYELLAGSAIPVYWAAIPAPGLDIDAYRWAVDPRDTTFVMDREHENSDPNHWSAWGHTQSVMIPADGAPEHNVYVQARDNIGHVSTLRLHFDCITAAHDRELLIVDDTRLTPDQLNPDGTIKPPTGTWPTAAELDTFLFARGGFPWQAYPAGTLSPRGLLDGYSFDTLGTRVLGVGAVPLSVLSRYRHVIWFTDGTGATYTNPPGYAQTPITSLRWMSAPSGNSTLAAYVGQGGSLWLSGGGAAYATLVDWNRRNTPPDDWTNSDLELIPGRFMYDFTHWRSNVAVRPGRQAVINTPDFAPWLNATMGRGWSGQGMDGSLTQPNYAKLSADPVMNVLRGRTCATDPPPPLRLCNSFYLAPSYPAEYIGRNPQFGAVPNFIREDTDPRPNHEDSQSTLDTLYMAVGGSVPGVLPAMTYYHGFESGPVVFSGFPFWFFQKQQATKLVDFVLQDIWGVSKEAGPAILTTAPLARQKGVISAATLSRQKGGVPVAAPVARNR